MFNWIADISGFQADTIQTYFVVFVIFLCILILLSIWKKFQNPISRYTRKRGHRLQIKEYIKIDAQRHLVLVQRDNVEHLLLVGGNTDVLVEKSIEMPTHYGFESEESDEKLVKKEGTLSEKVEDRDKIPEVLTTTNEIPSNSSNNFSESNIDASSTNNTDPYKTVEVEMNKLLSGVDKKSN